MLLQFRSCAPLKSLAPGKEECKNFQGQRKGQFLLDRMGVESPPGTGRKGRQRERESEGDGGSEVPGPPAGWV